MESHFNEVCSKLFYNGLLAATVTDRDGVVLLQSISEKAKANMADPILSTTFAVASNQASKLGLERNKSIISVYEQHQVIQFNQSPLIITLIADSSANTGLFINLGNNLVELTEPLVEALKE